MASFVKKLKERSDDLFSKRMPLISLWQDIAENFYPERADFTVQRYIGDEFMTNLTTSYPVIARRDLGDAINAALRPRNQNWFKISVRNKRELSHESLEWLERATEIQRAAMYDPNSRFVRATKEGDQDYVSFGQCVISTEINRKKNTLMYRCWHLRDVVWSEDYDGSICEVYRKTSCDVDVLNSEFKGNISADAKKILDKNPKEKIEYRHVVMPVDRYRGDKKFAAAYVSIYFECDSLHVLREEAVQNMVYCVPRWETVSGSQYAYSPAIVAALPDARLLQSMTLSLLEAGEMATQPPMFARQEIFRGDVQRFASGVTYVDLEPDQAVRDAIEFQQIDPRGISAGAGMAADVREMIAKAFYLDRLTLPSSGPEMTAFEVSQRVTEYIRNALPLFEPMEQNYNAPICDATFELLMANGAFGPKDEIPDELLGADIEFQFESPLYEAAEKRKAQVLLEGIQMGAQIEPLVPGVTGVIEAEEAYIDSLRAIGFPEKWTKDQEQLEMRQEQKAQQDELQQTLAALQQGGETAAAVGEGAAALQMGGVM